MKKDEKMASINDAMKSLNKKYGDNTVVIMKEAEGVQCESIPTGSFGLDRIFGCGGLPRGRMIEIFGLESSGKSTMSLFIVAQAQKQGLRAVWVDAEHAFDKNYAKNIGVNVDDLYVSQPMYGEEGMDVVREMAKTGNIDIIVVDSVAALVPKKEIDGEIEKENIALQARLMSKMMRVLAAEISRTNTAVIFINQLRDKIGVFWGAKTTTPGGRSLKFFASVRLEVKRGLKIKKGEDVIGNWMKIIGVKNKVGLPFKEANIELIYREGVDTVGDALDTAIDRKIINKKGNTYYYEEEKLGVGREETKKFLKDSPKIYTSIYNKLDGSSVKKTRKNVKKDDKLGKGRGKKDRVSEVQGEGTL